MFDVATLGRIWSGNITHWDDDAIANLNENITLPHQPITLCYGARETESISVTFKQVMKERSSEFDEALRAANNSMALLPPMLAGRGIAVTTNTTGRISCMQMNSGSLTYTDLATARSRDVVPARMKNSEGVIVTLNPLSIQAAMKDTEAELGQGTLPHWLFCT